MKKLYVIMPVYNEEEAIGGVLDEWFQELKKTNIPFTLCVLNDGSKDNTLNILNEYAEKNTEMLIIDKPNSGHGQTCIYGYKLAIKNGADWILQIDSDGQCDPKYLPTFLKEAENNSAVFGVRKTRDDGFKRVVISKFVRLFIYFATWTWVRDGNVPYRLIHADVMAKIIDRVPVDFYLANIYVSVLVQRNGGIKWTPIHFRNRNGGSPSVKTFSFMKHGIKLFKQLRDVSYVS